VVISTVPAAEDTGVDMEMKESVSSIGDLKVGQVVSAVIEHVVAPGVFVRLPTGHQAIIHRTMFT
jgi:hypothetical protein